MLKNNKIFPSLIKNLKAVYNKQLHYHDFVRIELYFPLCINNK